ncbi:MAG: hypothetical protein JNJ61_09050 [Anaerolineae bacterium]|nr:hypothetical protein [Anaerolineae bacterium]
MGNTRLYNIISLIFLVLTVLVIVFVVTRLLGPAPEAPQEVATLPEVLVLPTITPSNTPTRTPTATNTLTPTISPTPTESPTPTPTVSASPTITETPGPTDTPSATPTPSVSPTATPTETPTGPSPTPEPTLSPFLFDLREGEVIFTTNFANTAGCAWQGLGGQVFDLNGAPLTGLVINIVGPNALDRTVVSGSNSLYGVGGWEFPVDNKINNFTYSVELRSAAGTTISPRITVTFPADCARNLALVNFIQVRER